MISARKHSLILCLVSLSALSYALPFIAPRFWWLIFLFPLPLFVALDTDGKKIRLTFWHGFVWGVIAYGLQLYPAYTGVASLANRPSTYPFLLITSLALYLSFYSGVWFWVMGRTKSLLISALAATLYFHWIDAYSLWPLLRWEGYPFAHPLIPLTAHPRLLFLLPVLGKQPFTFFMFVPAALFAHVFFSPHSYFRLNSCFIPHKIFYKNKYFLSLSFALAMLFFSPPAVSPDRKAPLPAQTSLDLSPIAYLPLQAKGESCSLAALLSHKLRKIVGENPATKVVILPESALYTVLYSESSSPDNNTADLKTGSPAQTVCKTPDYAKIWNAQSLGKPISLVCGGFKKNKNNELLNTCYLFHDGVLMQEHSKTHTVPCAEQMPAWLSTASLESLFFSELAGIIPADNSREPFIIPAIGEFVPVICSELFFSQQILGYEGVPILALVNDARFGSEIFRELMLKTALVKAIEWQRDILYVSYAYGVYIGKNGSVKEISG